MKIRYQDTEEPWVARLRMFIVHPERDEIIFCCVQTFDTYRFCRNPTRLHAEDSEFQIRTSKRRKKAQGSYDLHVPEFDPTPMHKIIGSNVLVPTESLDFIGLEQIERRALLMPDFSSRTAYDGNYDDSGSRYFLDRFDHLSIRSAEFEELVQ